MKKYLSFFRLRFLMGLQYRAAAAAGVMTQFFWGAMEILMFRAFYRADDEAFPMTLSAACTYVWLQQAFLALFMMWMMENEIFEEIKNGNIAYELCRPADLYHMWFSRSIANRLSRALLRCAPILLTAFFIPGPYGMSLPGGIDSFVGFLLGMLLGLIVTTAFCMVIYLVTFFTVSPDGVRMVAVSGVEFLSGAVIPLPFFPEKMQRIMELLPFASMQNVPFRIYSGDLNGSEAGNALGIQLIWAIVLILLGKLLWMAARHRIQIQGG